MIDSLLVRATSTVAHTLSDVVTGKELVQPLLDRLEGSDQGPGEIHRGIGEITAKAEGWSAYELMDSADDVLGVGRVDDIPLLDSNGEAVTLVSKDELAIYDEAGLRPENVHGRECLVRDDIDPLQVDPMGRTNLERMEQGIAPLDAHGHSIELHHVQQENDGILAELTHDEHRQNDEILHDKEGGSEIDRTGFRKIKQAHWQARATEIQASHPELAQGLE